MTSSTAGAERAAPSLAHTLTVATLVQIVATASVLALTALAPLVAVELGIDAYWIGYQISAVYFAGMFSSITAGSLVARFGPVVVEQVALACFALGFAGLAAGHVASILAATIAIGIGYGLNNPASSQMLSRVTPSHRRNLVFSLKQSGVPVGGMVASLAFPFLAHLFGWRMGLATGAFAAAILWVWLALGHSDNPAERQRGGAVIGAIIREQSLIWRNARLRALSILGFLYSAMQLSMSAFTVVALVHDAGWSPLAAGSVAAAMQLAGACGRVGWGVVADRIGGGFVTLGVIGLISSAASVSLYGLAAMPLAAQVAVFIVMGAASIGWNGVLLAEIARNVPRQSVGAFTGAVLFYTFVGVIVGPSAFALLYAAVQAYGPSFLVMSSLGLVGALIAFRTPRSES